MPPLEQILPLFSVGFGRIELLSGFFDYPNSSFGFRSRFLQRFWPDAVPPFRFMGTFVPFRGTCGICGCVFVFSGSEVEPNANETRRELRRGHWVVGQQVVGSRV